jgi:hypothetical protein
MTSTYAIKARYYTRQAWIHLGKAREAKLSLRACTFPDVRAFREEIVRNHAYFARSSMRCATIYRQIDGRL